MPTLKENILAAGIACSAPLVEDEKGKLTFESVIAERKSFLSRKKLSYRCTLKIDDTQREVRFFEMLKESGFGLSGAGGSLGPGFSVKKESYRLSGKEREGSIQESASLFGKKYSYSFDYAQVRNGIKKVVEEAGYTFKICLLERSL